MNKARKLISLFAVGSMVAGMSMCAVAEHTHNYQVVGKTLYSVRKDSTHEYIAATETDPITGITRPIYETCTVYRRLYKGTWTCLVKENGVTCGVTRSDPYYFPAEYDHTKCGQ